MRGRYVVHAPIASGGMGIVHRATDRVTRREVAYKRLVVQDPAHGPRLTALFQREFTTLAQLAHPRIIEVYEYGIDSEGPFYAMELLSGSDLSALAPMPYREACRHLRDVASALALLHTRRLLHRDITPSNVRLTSDGRAKLIDFGALAPFGCPAEIVGTPSSMAPEVLGSSFLDQRADLYGLGALAYHLLTGRRAVRANSVRELPSAWAEGIIPPSRFAALPPELDQLVLSLLRHDPLGRPSSAGEVIDRLTVLADLEPEEEQIGLSYVANPRLVGRGPAIARLEALRRRAADGEGSAVSISGASGTGRTALLSELARSAQLEGALVLRAEASIHGGTYGVARALAEAAMAAVPTLGAELALRHRALIGHWFPRVTRMHKPDEQGRSGTELAERRARTRLALQDWLLELSAQTPVIVMVDDAHQADGDSLTLLASLAHEAEGRPLWVVATVASGKPVSDAEALSMFARAAETIPLSALELDDVAELVSTLFGEVPNSARLALWLHGQSGGSPLIAMELLQLLVRRKIVRYGTGTFSLPYEVLPEQLPQPGESAISALFADLGPLAAALAQVLCMHGEPLTLEQCSAALARSPAEVDEAAKELATHGLLAGAGGAYAFAHESHRAAVDSTVAEGARAGLHLRLGRALLATEQSSPELRVQAGFHLLRGGDEARAVDVLSEASFDLAYRAEGTAKGVRALEAALELFDEQGRPDAHCVHVLVALAAAGYFADRRLYTKYGARAYEALLEMTGTNVARRLARFLPGKLAVLLGLLSGWVRYLLTPKRLRVRSFSELVTGLFSIATVNASAAGLSYEPEVAFAIAERLEPFRPLGEDDPANILRDVCRSTATQVSGLVPDSVAIYRSVIERLAKPSVRAKLPDEVRMLCHVGMRYGEVMAELATAKASALEAADEIEASGIAFYRPHAELLRVLHYAYRGEQGLADAHRARYELRAQLGGAGWSVETAAVGRLAIAYRHTRDTMGLLAAAHELDRLSSVVPALAQARDLALAYVEVLRDRPERALPVYERVLFDQRYAALGWRMEHGCYAEALIGVGRFEDARRVCSKALEGLRPEDAPYVFVHQTAARQLARAEAALGDLPSAIARTEGLLTDLASSENPLLLGALHGDRARLAILAGDTGAFRRHARLMERHFRSTANPVLLAQCEALLGESRDAGVPGTDSIERSVSRDEGAHEEESTLVTVLHVER